MSNLVHFDTIELYFEDTNGCPNSFSTNFSVPQFSGVTVIPANGCGLLGEVNVIGDPITGNGGIARILMNGVVETTTIPFDTLNAIGGTQVHISIEDQFGCHNDTLVLISVLGGHQIITDTMSGSVIGVSCNNGNDGTATVSAYGIDQFGIPDGVPIASYTWTHPTAPTFGGTAIDSVLINAVSGVWTVTVVDQFGCLITLNVFISNPDPITNNNSVIVNPTTGLSNGSINILVNGGTPPMVSYTVEDANGIVYPTSGSMANGLPAGTYTITVEDSNGCIGSFSVVLNDTPLSIDDMFILTNLIDGTGRISNLKLYPDPATVDLNISFDLSDSGIGSLKVYDLKGILIIDLQQVDLVVGHNDIVLELTDLPSGTYLVNLKMETDSQMIKFIKQ
jgi:hypothetical protein